jgi:hypothetical protein
MAREKFIGAGGKSVADPGVAAMKARVKAQRAEHASASEATKAPEEDTLIAMRHRVKTQKAAALETHAARDKASAAAAKKFLSEAAKPSKKSTTTAGD